MFKPLRFTLWMFGLSLGTSFGQSTLTVPVSLSTDDAEELSATNANTAGLSTGDVDLSSSDLELVDDAFWNGTGQTVGLRFNNIPIRTGATISEAHIEFTAKASGSEPTSLTIRAEASGNASTFENTPNNISSRPVTTTSVEWNEIEAWTTGETYTSPDLAALIQEVIAMEGWGEGNSIAFIIEGSGVRNAKSFDGGNAPQLVVNYSQEAVVYVPELVREIPDQELKTGWALNLDIKPFFKDRDSELSFTATGPEGTALPAGLSFNDGVLSGSLSEAQVLSVMVTAESEGASVSDQFLIFVEPQQTKLLTKLGTIKLGDFDEGAAEISTFDETSNRLFVTNAQNTTIDVIDMNDPENLQLIKSIDISAFGSSVTSISAFKGKIAAAIVANTKTDNGFVYVFDNDGNVLWNVEVGALPDMLTFNENGTKILVANEGEPNSDYSIDPEGSVSIIDTTTKAVSTADFTAFNGQKESLTARGVRIFGPGATVAQDLEPEYITVSGGKAYVTLQENNAIAEVDIATAQVTKIIGLGYKDHSLPGNGLDVPETDEIYISNWPFKGMYLPDAIESYIVGGKTYLVTVNEGDARDYDTYSEESEIGDEVLDPASFPNAERIQEVASGLKISTALADTTADGKYKTLYTFGTRSFTIWDAENESIVFDSKDQLEQITASIYPENFNASNSNFKFKNRSDDKGPEPEAVTLGEINGKIYAFIGLERIGGIMIYDVTDPLNPSFVEYFNNRDFSAENAEVDEAGDSGPEKIEFIPAANSPVGVDLIVVSNEVSGTVTAYSIGEAQQPFTLAVFHNNDGESDLLPEEIEVNGKTTLGGGIGQFKATLDSLREQTKSRGYESVMLSSGDNFLAGLEYNASTANGIYYDAVALDSLKYDAIDLGNHDFDFGTSVLADFINSFQTNKAPYLSANLSFENVPALKALVDNDRIKPATIVNKGGEQIGIIGLTTPLLPTISSPGNTIVSEAIIDSVQKQVDILVNAGVNKIILISHLQNLNEEINLAGQVNGIDIIIAGGGDELLANDATLGEPYNITPAGAYPVVATDIDGDEVYIVTTPGNYRYLGNLLVDFNSEGKVTRVYNSDPVLITGIADSSLVEVVEDPIRQYIGDLSTNVIAVTEDDLDFRRESLRHVETNGGNLFADAILYQVKKTHASFGVKEPQVAIQNSGGLRLEAIVEQGNFTEDLTYDIAAFTNIVSVVEDIDPAKFLELIEHGVANAPLLDGRFPQIAGFEIVYDQGKPSGERVSSITLKDGTKIVEGGQVVEGVPAITLATIDFTANGGDGYPFAPLTYTTLGATYQQALYNYLTAEDALNGVVTNEQYPAEMNDRIFVEVTRAPAVASVNENFDANCPELPEGWVEFNSDNDLIACAGSGYIEFNGYSAGAGKSWLISPRITLGADDYILSFNSRHEFSGPDAEVLYSTDYNGIGDPAEATWMTLSEATAAINVKNGSFLESGELDLSFITEEAYIAFVYTSNGTGGGNSTRLRLDQVKIDKPADVVEGGAKTISEIQGAGDVSPYENVRVETGGIVTAFFNGAEPYSGAGYNANIEGFYIQNSNGDANQNTSDGIFVASAETVSVGDSITLSAVVKETYGLTQLAEVSDLTVVSNNHSLPAVTLVSLPVSKMEDFEMYEGMLVKFADELTVTENRNLDNYGELRLAAGGKLYQPSQIVDPNDDPESGNTANGNSNAAAVSDYLQNNQLRQFILDDARDGFGNMPVPYLSGEGSLLAGSTVSNLTGIFTYGFGAYRVQPVEAPVFNYAEREEVPSVGNASLKVVSFNVLNYFNGDGQGGGFPTSRGAADETELAKQTQKIVSALTALNGDVVGLIEIENDEDNGFSAIKSLVDSINTKLGATVYDFVETGVVTRQDGSADEIKCGFIYKTSTVNLVGDYAILNNSFDVNYNDEKSRPAVAQTFEEIASGERFTAVVNHFKSKGSDCNSLGDPDDGDGQGNCNVTRTMSAGTLASWLETDPTGSNDEDFLILGDLNAYAQEDPIDTLRARGFVTLTSDDDYSYVFDGQYGSLDHGMANQNMLAQVTETKVWHINSLELDAMRYDGVNEMFAANPYGSSDHDPVVIGLNLTVTGVDAFKESAGIHFYPNPTNGKVNFSKVVSGKIVNELGMTLEVVKDVSSLNLTNYNKGLYFLILEDGNSLKIILK